MALAVPADDLPDTIQAVPTDDLPDNPTVLAKQSATQTVPDVGPFGVAETALHVGTGIAASIPAGVASLYELATAPKGQKLQNMRRASTAVQGALTYEPRTQTGKLGARAVDKVLGLLPAVAEKAGMGVYRLAGSGNTGATLGAATDVAIQSIPIILGYKWGADETGEAISAEAAEENAAAAARQAARAVHYIETKTGLKWNSLSDDFKNTMNIISNSTDDLNALDPKAVEREGRASAQNVPMTRGQATRDLSQITREENLRKSPSGAPLRSVMAQQDEALYQNLDTLRQEAGKGSKVRSTTDVGKSVQGVLRRKLDVLEEQRNTLYEKARSAGETQVPVNTAALDEWLKNPTNARNAPWLKSAIDDYQKSGTVSINDLEEIRKEAVANALGPPSVSTHFAGESIGVIDNILDQAGGSVYKESRAAHRAIKMEFDRQGAIRKLSGEKARTSDPAVALEDTLDQVVVRGSNQDLANVKQSLLTGPTKAQGERAWSDLQAGAIDYLKEKAGGKRRIQGEEGQGQFNSSFLDALYDIDRDGKLDTLFSPSVAERVRNLAKTVHDVRTSPAGRISGSDSVPRIINLLDKSQYIPLVGPTVRATLRGGAELIKKFYGVGKEATEVEGATRSPVTARAAQLTEEAARAQRIVPRIGRAARVPGAIAAAEASEQDQ